MTRRFRPMAARSSPPPTTAACACGMRAFPGHDHFVWSVALSRDGKHALSGSLDRTVRLWDVETGSMLKKLEGHHDTVLSVAFSPTGRHAVSGSSDKTVILWDLETAK